MTAKSWLIAIVLGTCHALAGGVGATEQDAQSSKTCQELTVEVETLLSLKNQAEASFWGIKGNQLAASEGA